ncbi:MAG: hypothetical protein F6J99_07275 [Moorea sp. SIO4G3]|nr:hypothetical protein [Moorena sp. SIO4G3]
MYFFIFKRCYSRESGIGNRESGTGNREQGIGNREEGIGNRDALHQDRESTSKKTIPHNCEKGYQEI